MEQILLSFIIPVYNVYQYLNECIDSIVHQIEPECELVLVDDGSTDGSGRICDERAEQDQHIRVIHKANGGLSSARNEGMAHARGKYIAFVDSDDRIADNAIPALLRWIQEGGSDICFMKAIKFFPNGSSESLGDGIQYAAVHEKSKEQVIAHLSTRPKYPGSACTKIFRKDFLDRWEIHFPYDRRSSEDLAFVLHCLQKAESFDSIPVPYYEYRQARAGSITYSKSAEHYSDLLTFVTESAAILAPEGKPVTKLDRDMLSFVAYEYSLLLWLYDMQTGEKRIAAKQHLRKYRWVLKYGKSIRIRMICLIHAVCGTEMTSKLITKGMAIRRKRKQ